MVRSSIRLKLTAAFVVLQNVSACLAKLFSKCRRIGSRPSETFQVNSPPSADSPEAASNTFESVALARLHSKPFVFSRSRFEHLRNSAKIGFDAITSKVERRLKYKSIRSLQSEMESFLNNCLITLPRKLTRSRCRNPGSEDEFRRIVAIAEKKPIHWRSPVLFREFVSCDTF